MGFAKKVKFHLRMGSTRRLIAPGMLPGMHPTYRTHSNSVSGMFVGDFDLNPTEISGKFATRFRNFPEFDPREVIWEVSEHPTIGFGRKDPGFVRFMDRSSDPQNLSKKY